ncbi:MAG TPA: hypothetical protein VGF67_00930 [Ktedonobacteraceae bacterium]
MPHLALIGKRMPATSSPRLTPAPLPANQGSQAEDTPGSGCIGQASRSTIDGQMACTRISARSEPRWTTDTRHVTTGWLRVLRI